MYLHPYEDAQAAGQLRETTHYYEYKIWIF